MILSLSVTLVATLTLAVLLHWDWKNACAPKVHTDRDQALHLSAALFRLAMVAAAVALVSLIPAPGVRGPMIALIGLAWFVHELLDVTCWKFLSLPFFKMASFSSVKVFDRDALRNLLTAMRTFIPVGNALRLGIATLLAAAAIIGWGSAAAGLLVALGLSLAALAVQRLQSRTIKAQSIRHSERPFFAIDPTTTPQRLRAGTRAQACKALPDRQNSVETIIIILNESAGDDVTCHGGIDLADAICQLDPTSPTWLRPQNPVTPSTCTDIAVPCIFTGCAPVASADQLHRMPLLFDLAKARGWATLFYSASTLRWANFETFFGGNPNAIDALVTPQSAGLPFVNDLGCDDYLLAEQFAARLRHTDGPVLGVFYTNGLHVPFLDKSACPVPDHITDRRCRAAHLVTQTHRVIFDALRETGRFDGALILSIGDHGETFGVDAATAAGWSSRLTNLPDAVTRPLFVIKPPAALPDADLDTLTQNMRRLVSLIDVAPTVAGALGVRLAPELGAFAGYDLIADIIPETRVHYTLNTNEWRAWPLGAAMVAQGDLRLCADYQCDQTLLCDGNGKPLPESRWPQVDALLAIAQTEPVVGKAIAQVFQNKVRL